MLVLSGCQRLSSGWLPRSVQMTLALQPLNLDASKEQHSQLQEITVTSFNVDPVFGKPQFVIMGRTIEQRNHHEFSPNLRIFTQVGSPVSYPGMGQNPIPLVNIKIAGIYGCSSP